MPQIVLVILLFFEQAFETDYLLSKMRLCRDGICLYATLPYSSPLTRFSAALLTIAFLPGSEYSHVFEGPAVLLLLEAIKRPQTRSADASQVSNAHERDLVTFHNTFDLKRA